MRAERSSFHCSLAVLERVSALCAQMGPPRISRIETANNDEGIIEKYPSFCSATEEDPE